MTEPKESVNIKILSDAGFEPIPLQESYLKAIEFVQKVRRSGCDIIQENCLACDALSLLREIGEEK